MARCAKLTGCLDRGAGCCGREHRDAVIGAANIVFDFEGGNAFGPDIADIAVSLTDAKWVLESHRHGPRRVSGFLSFAKN
jgi:hypothetical protein